MNQPGNEIPSIEKLQQENERLHLSLEEEQKRSEQRYQEIIRNSPAAIFDVDFRAHKFTAVNDTMCKLSGYSREELFSMSPFDILYPESQALFQQRIQKWLAGEKPAENVEYKVKARDGHDIYALLNTTFTRDETGAPLGRPWWDMTSPSGKCSSRTCRTSPTNTRCSSTAPLTACGSITWRAGS